MKGPLPELRAGVEVMPSPFPEHPGILLRDPFRFTDDTVVVPPQLAPGLGLLDGRHELHDLKKALGTADLEEAQAFVDALDQCGFLATPSFEARRASRIEAFQSAPTRASAHAGSGYPNDESELIETFASYLAHGGTTPRGAAPRGLAAPHVSPFGGASSYAAAYQRLGPEHKDCTFVVLGTSHYGEPYHFGLTHKSFETPFGRTRIDRSITEALEKKASSAVLSEDYCHSFEHSIEFQVVFLQHALQTADVKIAPILCGPFVDPRITPEDRDPVRRFFDALAEIAALRDDLVFILGVDLAHVGMRYGDEVETRAFEGPMVDVEALDLERVSRVLEGDAEGYLGLVTDQGDDPLKWCGHAPIYTFLKVCPEARGELLSYEQWNIDEGSVVSFAALEFSTRTPR